MERARWVGGWVRKRNVPRSRDLPGLADADTIRTRKEEKEEEEEEEKKQRQMVSVSVSTSLLAVAIASITSRGMPLWWGDIFLFPFRIFFYSPCQSLVLDNSERWRRKGKLIRLTNNLSTFFFFFPSRKLQLINFKNSKPQLYFF